jgi:hypothetical protein
MQKSNPVQDNPETSAIDAVYHSFIQTKEYCEFLSENELDIDWLKSKLNEADFYKLENDMIGYASKNDKLMFLAGFKYAWKLFHECNKLEFQPKSKT